LSQSDGILNVIQAASQLIDRFKMGNEQNILPKKEYLIYLFTLIIALNGKFLSNFLLFLNCDTAWLRGAQRRGNLIIKGGFDESNPYSFFYEIAL